MAKAEGLEELIAWQKARILTNRIYEISRQGAFARDFGLSSQIQRASVSIMSNIAEGSERGSKEFHQFLVMAKASAAEVRSHLYVVLDVGYIDQSTFNELNALTIEVGRIVGALRASIARNLSQQ
jgi:four helix bundle protein